MIHKSDKPDDMAFIARTLKERALDSKVLPEFFNLPGAWEESNRWKRVVETYPWGTIVFLSDRKLDLHATLVIEGQLNIRSGAVVAGRALEHVSSVVPWYKELAARLNVTLSTTTRVPIIEVPKCLGHHQGDHICDGGYNPSSQLERPCAWRSRCIALQGHCAKVSQLPADVLKGKSPDEVARFTSELQAAESIPPLPVPAEPPQGSAAVALSRPTEPTPLPTSGTKVAAPRPTPRPVPRPVALAKPAGAVTVTAAPQVGPNPDALQLFKDIWAEFQKQMAQVGSGSRQYLPTEEGAKLGDIFLSDRSKTSAYISVYAQPEKGRKAALFAVRLRTGVVGVQLPLLPEHPLLAALGANVVKWKDGKFQSEVKPIPTNVSVQDICRVIVAAIQTGAIELPGYTVGTEEAA